MEKASKRYLPLHHKFNSKKWISKTNSHRSVYPFLIKSNTKSKLAKFICSDKTSLNKQISYIRRTMLLNGYPLNNINKTVKGTLQIHNSEHKSKELELLKMFILYKKGAAEKLKRVASKYAFTTTFTKTKDLRGQKLCSMKIWKSLEWFMK